jgi:tetratricopeptide (TPR) repeat protein
VDEAISYYERAADANARIGNTAGAPLARMNIAEILIDRGEWAEGEALLLETLPFWKASRYRYFLALCLSYLGRALVRQAASDEALNRLEEAKLNFVQIEPTMKSLQSTLGSPNAVSARGRTRPRRGARHARARDLVECRGQGGAAARARAGHALLRKGDLRGAREAFEVSLGSAPERGASASNWP